MNKATTEAFDGYKAMFARVQSVHSANPNKMEVIMNNRPKRTIHRKPILAIVAITIIAALSVTAYAIVTLLTPAEIARELGHDALAQAFENGEGILIEESVASKGFVFTLHGMATGENLLAFYEEAEDSKTMLVLSVRRENGRPMDYFNPETIIGDTYFSYCVVFEGFKPWLISSRTIGGTGGQMFEKDGVLYVLLDCSSFDIFADRNPSFVVWNAVEIGIGPGSELFQMRENGSIAFADGMQVARAMFRLPLDPAKADPAKVEQLLKEHGVALDGSLLPYEDIPEAYGETSDGPFRFDDARVERERIRRSLEEPETWAAAD